MNEETKELIMQAGGRAPGPLRVALEMATEDALTGRVALEMAIEQGITGGELWILYKDVHNGDLAATREALTLKTAVGQLQKLPYSCHHKAE